MATQLPPQTHIATDQELEEKLAEKGLKVIELYAEWCGPCKSHISTLKKLRLEKDDVHALQFLSVCSDDCEILEAAAEHRGKSQPLFLLYRNGMLKQSIAGPNTPALAAAVLALVPLNADMDDQQENPFYLAKNQSSAKAAGGK